MEKWPLPNLDGGNIRFDRQSGLDNWHFGYPEDDYPINFPEIKDLPEGWGNPWPKIPDVDTDFGRGVDLSTIKLSEYQGPCGYSGVLGYYISYHILGVSFENEMGRPAIDGNELKEYNDSLPEQCRYGIHICIESIENYIESFDTRGLPPSHVPFYREYCTFLTLIYVIAHEWGHYRSEVLSFQLRNVVKSITGDPYNAYSPSYLSYFVNKKRFPDINFEEIFAEWAALKVGIFNFHLADHKPHFATLIPNWPQVEATVKFMLTKTISDPNRPRPYSDIRYWIDFKRLTEDHVLKRFSSNSRSMNRSVNDNTKINLKSFKRGRITDLLVHNQIQFSTRHRFNGIVTSRPLNYPYEPDSLFYHMGEDECVGGTRASATSRKVLRLSDPEFLSPAQKSRSFVGKVLDDMKQGGARHAVLPIKVFPEILPLNPVYFHV